MAQDNRAAWGIDIGQAGLKALKLRYAEAAGQAIAVGFDYVPHPKILSQPDAIPEELIPQAIDTFLSRNSVDGDLVAISVPGKQSLARFIELPPVERKNINQIVGYEAKQQIPFPLEEVIWDYQTLGNPEEVEVEKRKLLMGAEVGLFAMKKGDVNDRLAPFQKKKIEVELIQPGPVALYNQLVYDEMGWRPGQDAPGGSEHYIVLDMGCDDTTLIISNGSKIWIKSVRIGGNNFTRALVKDLKLSFAKAEHLKCNATKAPDPKSVFQALRPVFNEFVQEIQRAVGFFSGVNAGAEIVKVFGLGNGFKLAGLQKFLQQNLDYEVVRPETFPALQGDAVLNSPMFQENLLSFPVSYGLALQALGAGKMETSLLPPEIVTQRLIRKKKPWAVVGAASLLAGLSLSMAVNGAALASVDTPEFAAAIEDKKKLDSELSQGESAYNAQVSAFEAAKTEITTLTDGRRSTNVLEFHDAFNATLPRDEGNSTEIHPKDRMAISVNAMASVKKADVGAWFTELSASAKENMPAKYRDTPPSGEGYVFTINGTSWHDEYEEGNYDMSHRDYVQNTLVANLAKWQITGPDGKVHDIGRMGITHPVITDARTEDIYYDPTGNAPPQGGSRLFGGQNPINDANNNGEEIKQTDFILQFVYKPIPEAERLDADPNAPAEEAATDAAAPAGDAPAEAPPA